MCVCVCVCTHINRNYRRIFGQKLIFNSYMSLKLMIECFSVRHLMVIIKTFDGTRFPIRTLTLKNVVTERHS